MTWQPAQTPFVPGDNAVKGGPGSGGKPNAPLYVCRVYDNNALLPGKWVEGDAIMSTTLERKTHRRPMR